MALPETWMNELMNRNDIVSVVSEYTQLKPKGGRMWGLCPFHPERDASFTVTPDKQLFHCFSCKAGGSVIQFIMQAENLPYIDAIRFLAQRVNMDMPDEIDDARLMAEKARRERLYDANRAAARYYHSMLLSDAGLKARQYLIRRGIDGGTAVRFGLGYAPNDWDALFKHLTELGFKREDLIDAGLCVRGRKDESKTFDFFHDRLMFPVIAANGTVVAFGGRILDGGDEAKYMNTGDTPIYNKKHNIYAINLMKGKRHGELIMVEGYMDVISLHQAGIETAVASLGTALTSQQARLLGRFAPRVYYAYDGDAAGQKAMRRGVDILSENGVEPRVIIIPEGKDPDEFVKAYGAEAFLKLKDASITATQFKLESIASEFDLFDPDGREGYAKSACLMLASLQPVERDRYIRLVSERSGMSIDTIKQQCGVSDKNANEGSESKSNNSPAYRSSGYKKRRTLSERERAEQMLLACMMVSRADAAQIVQLDGYDEKLFSLPGMASFAKRLIEAYGIGSIVAEGSFAANGNSKADIRMMIASLEGEESFGPSAAVAQAEDIVKPVDSAADCIRFILKSEYDARIRELAELSATETDPKKRAELLKEQMALVIKSRAIR